MRVEPAGSGQPGEHRRQRPGAGVEPHDLAVAQHARRVFDQAAAGDVRQRLDPAGGDGGEAGCHVDAGRRQQRVAEPRPARTRGRGRSAQALLAQHEADQREAVGVNARGGEAQHHIAVGDPVGRGSTASRSTAPTAKPARSNSPRP